MKNTESLIWKYATKEGTFKNKNWRKRKEKNSIINVNHMSTFKPNKPILRIDTRQTKKNKQSNVLNIGRIWIKYMAGISYSDVCSEYVFDN